MACFSARCWAWGGMVDRRTTASLRAEARCFRQLRNHDAHIQPSVWVVCYVYRHEERFLVADVSVVCHQAWW